MKMTEGQRAELLGAATYFIGKAVKKLEMTLHDSDIEREVDVPLLHEITVLNECYNTIGDMANKLMKEYKEAKVFETA